jgi:frataxin
MEWQESDFSKCAETFLEMLFEQLEEQDNEGILDIDLQDGILMIETLAQEFVVSRHSPSQQVWLSSPLSGGLHFSPSDNGRDWKLPDGRRLSVVLGEELSMITGTDFNVEV